MFNYLANFSWIEHSAYCNYTQLFRLFPLQLEKLKSDSPFRVSCSSGNIFGRYFRMVPLSF